ncbi:MAG TPA: AAA family ATPase, partial [Candidatus Limnocylindrales bacterium]|nr:AAA family ATPase [Candidatus Limnocylindrales bacterium]
MLTGLDWSDLPRLTARDILAHLLGVTDKRKQLLQVSGKVSPLPFWKEWRLVVLSVDNPKGGEDQVFEDIFCLWRAGEEPLLLDGASDSIHEVNEREGLELQEPHVADYIRFFCYFLVANGEPFIIWEQPPKKVAAKDRNYVALVKPLTFVGNGAHDGWQYEGTVVYANHVFKAVFAVAKNGELEMLDDDPLIGGVPDRVLPAVPPLGYGPRVGAYLTTLAGGPPPSGGIRKQPGTPRQRRTRQRRPTIVELVELLLEAALKAQAENRLLTYFNAALPTATELQRFAALFDQASPVIVVETGIPFVEETIGEIVNGLRGQQQGRISVYEADITTDSNGTDAINQFRGLMQGPGIVLLPMQVYPRILLVERLAFEIADKDLGAIVACQAFGDLPEALRRYADIVLKLPPIDDAIFAELFHRVIGKPLPVAWKDGGTEWVKHLLHTDFEHPRRMQLPPGKAFAYIRAQVGDRLRSVDPGRGLGLEDLFGMGEARLWAEDLIADIHAAIAGTLPWSQVDMGALLVGPPGTGKTTLANAIAKGCGIKFIQGSASSWMAEGVSLGPHIAAIRKTFAEARDYAPSILFIDEIDSIGSRERLEGDRNSLYITEVINAVLEQMQGLDAAAPVVVIGATNHENAVDPALRRSGRLDRVIRIPRPNAAALANIYSIHLGKLGSGTTFDAGVDTTALGRLSIGLTGADVERIVRGAARRA